MNWYVMVETYELGEESYSREEFKTFEETQQFYEKTEGAWKPQRIKVSSLPNLECEHQWLKNGTRKGIQQWICKHCGKSRSGDGTVKRGRPFKQI